MIQDRSAAFSHVNRQWLEPGDEPALTELLADPVLRAVMRRDGVTTRELCNHIAQARTRLGLGPIGLGPIGLGPIGLGPCRCAA